jgi:uncharacterized protein (TIRG00374 family)
MKKRIISILKYFLFLAIGIGLVWWQVSGMSAEDKTAFGESVKNIRYILLIPIIIISLLSHYLRGLRWKMMIDPIKTVSAKNSFYSVMVGYLVNTFVPRAGEIVRCTMMARYERVSFSKLIGTVIVERIFDLLCYAVFILLTIILQLELVGGFVSESLEKIFSKDADSPRWLKFGILLIILLLLYLIANRGLKKFAGNKYVSKIKNLWHKFKEGLTTIFHLERKGLFLIYTFLIWFFYLIEIYLGFKAVSATQHLGIGAAMSVLSLSTLAMIISPGGLGAFPVAVQQVLIIYNINNISFGWLMWGVNTVFIIVAGAICFALLAIQKRKPQQETSDTMEETIT